MTIKDLLRQNRLNTHVTSEREIQELLNVVERDIADAQLSGLSDDRAFATAYNAVLQLCVIIMAVEGYRTRGKGHQKTTFEFIEFIEIPIISDFAIYFNKCRQKRNDVDYDRVLVVTTTQRIELIEKAIEFRNLTRQWLSNKGYGQNQDPKGVNP